MTVDRVVYAVLHVDPEVVRGMDAAVADRPDACSVLLRRPTMTGEVSTLATLATGVGPLRHGVHTRLVPAEGRTEGLGEAMKAADLRPRTSRDTAAPFIWNRLADRGITTAAIGWPLVEAQDDDRVMELGMSNLLRIAAENETMPGDAALGAIRGGIESRPDLRCICLHAWLREGVPDTESADSDDDGDDLATEDETADEGGPVRLDDEQKVAVVLSWIEAVAKVSEATHVLAVLLGPRIGRHLLIGPRAAGVDVAFGMPQAGVPTVLALLGEPTAADLPGRSILSEGEGDDEARPSKAWSIEGGPLSPPDFTEAIARVRRGEAPPLLEQVVRRHLSETFWVGLSEGDGTTALDAARVLVELGGDPINRIRLILALMATGGRAEAIAEVQRLGEEHPDSPLSRLARTLAPVGLSDEEVGVILDETPFDELPGPLARGIWGRAAARIGRDDDALDALWRLIAGGYALNHDRLGFATLAVKRNQGQDAQRAVLATRGMTGLATGPEGRPRTGVALLRAQALSRAGRTPAAVALLEQFLEHHPLEEQAAVMLKKLRGNED